jgi:F420H(2)-dependent quinone reductase
MTAQLQALRTPPRFLVRTFWVLHRTGYRLTGGRFGLSQPEAGQKFGLMRLHTTGRRSGKARAAIIGYFEDGPNLVTLAMNGWGEAEPSWWMNLQATSLAKVDLADGGLVVRGRVATGQERDRLWAKFADYPGWGADIDALAARRSATTAVVVLEPTEQTAATTSVGQDDGAPAQPDDAGPGTSSTSVSAPGRPRRLRLRHLWLVPGIALSLFANAQGAPLGVGLIPLLVFGIAPDLPRLIGLRRPGMVPLHNVLHNPAAGLMLLLGATVVGGVPVAYIGALAWLSHIVVGWGVGDRMRSASARSGGTPTGAHPGHMVLAPATVTTTGR